MNQLPRITQPLLFVAFLIVSSSVAATPPTVTSVSPAPQSMDAHHATDVVIDFDQPLDTTTVNASTVRIFGRWSGPMQGTYNLEAGNARVRFIPDRLDGGVYSAGEWVTVSLSKGIENESSEPMALGYQWNFWIGTQHGLLDLSLTGTLSTRQDGEGWIQSYGAYAGDLNNDDWTDLLVPNERPDDARVFLNDGAGAYDTFTVYSPASSNTPSPNEGADFNMDGEIDVVITSTAGTDISIMLGDGTGGFYSNLAYTADSAVRGVCVLDLDGDGFDDVVTSNRFGGNIALLLNNGDGTFGTATLINTIGANEFSCASADFNNDGLLDVIVGAYTSTNVVLMLGDGMGGLVYSSNIAIGGRAWQVAVGDINGDGNVDVAAANADFDNAGVAYGDGAGGFDSTRTYVTGGFPLAIDLGDIDGDGDLELVTSDYDDGTWTLYENLGGYYGNKRTLNASIAGSCAILHDRNRDQSLDITGVDELADQLFFFTNTPQSSAVGPTALRGVTLRQNHPNPFNPTTTITFDLAEAATVDLTVFDAGGRFVRRLDRGQRAAGVHRITWNGTDERGEPVASGLYFYRLEMGGEVVSRKMVLLK